MISLNREVSFDELNGFGSENGGVTGHRSERRQEAVNDS